MKRTGFANKRKPMNKVSAKRKANRKSQQGQDGTEYMKAVKALPCCICGAAGPSDAHHCRSMPHADEPVYEREPCAGRKSGDHDTIPLCKSCHQDGPLAYHYSKREWEARNGPDWRFIIKTRAALDYVLPSATD